MSGNLSCPTLRTTLTPIDRQCWNPQFVPTTIEAGAGTAVQRPV